MGRQEARRAEDRIQLDTLVRVRRYEDEGETLSDDVTLWAAIESGRNELDVRRDGTTLTFPLAFVVRWDARWESLAGVRLYVNLPETPDRSDRIHNVVRIGRRRFLRLEVEA